MRYGGVVQVWSASGLLEAWLTIAAVVVRVHTTLVAGVQSLLQQMVIDPDRVVNLFIESNKLL